MKKMIKKALAIGLATAAFSSTSLYAQDVKIGALFPMSGLNATYGDIFGSGANLAVSISMQIICLAAS